MYIITSHARSLVNVDILCIDAAKLYLEEKEKQNVTKNNKFKEEKNIFFPEKL